MTRTALYRHFDSSGGLLYIGITDHLTKRGSQHARTSEWLPLVSKTEAEWFGDRAAAEAAERIAIRQECPAFNRAHKDMTPGVSLRDIINALGAEVIQTICDVGEFSIRAAKREGRFPASWFDAIERACADAGHECPRRLFAFKSAKAFSEAPQ